MGHQRDVPSWRFADSPAIVELRVKDTGSGIPDESRPHMFVPFYTTKEKGTGLGLAICQRIVQAHQGSIAVRSAPGQGAEFRIALPGLREERPSSPPPALDQEGRTRARERRRAEAEARLRKRRRKRRA